MEPSSYSISTPEIQTMVPKVLVYPNPAESYIIFKYDGAEIENMQLEVFDMLGRQVFVKEIQNNVQLNIEDWPKGLYMFNLKNKGILLNNGKFIIR